MFLFFLIKGSSMLYLSPTCLECPSTQLAFVQPYEEGITLCKRAVKPLNFWKEPTRYFSRESDASTPLIRRISFLLIGIVLLIPIINSIAILILRSVEKQQIKDLFANVDIDGDWKNTKIIFLGDTHTDKGQSKTQMAFFLYMLKHHPLKDERPPALLVEGCPFIDDPEYEKNDFYKKISEIDLNTLNLNGNAFMGGWENWQKFNEHGIIWAKIIKLNEKMNKLANKAFSIEKNLRKINLEIDHSDPNSDFNKLREKFMRNVKIYLELKKEWEQYDKREDQLTFERTLAMISAASKTAATASRVFVIAGSGHLKLKGSNGKPGGIVNILKQIDFPFECAMAIPKRTCERTTEKFEAYTKSIVETFS
jgi:hypothetical protein